MLQLCPISLMQLPALPRHMAPSILFSNRSSCTTWFAFSLFHSQRPLRSTTAFALSQRAQLLALPSTCGLWIPGSAAWHTPGCTLGPATTSRENTICMVSVLGCGARAAPQRAALQPHHSAAYGKQDNGISYPQWSPCSQFPFDACSQHQRKTEQELGSTEALSKQCPQL